jgi:hypothetical protein
LLKILAMILIAVFTIAQSFTTYDDIIVVGICSERWEYYMYLGYFVFEILFVSKKLVSKDYNK